MEATNDYKGYEAQSQGRGGQVGNFIIWQDIYINIAQCFCNFFTFIFNSNSFHGLSE